MAPSPIYMDLPPLEGLTYYKKNSGSDLIKKIELTLDEFAQTESDDTPLKDFLKSFFSNNKVLVNFMHFSTLSNPDFISDWRHFDVSQPTQGFLS